MVACHAYDGRFYFWGWVEDLFRDGEQIFYVIPSLHEHTQYAVVLVARPRGHAFGDLLLYHAAATGYAVFVVENLEKYLARYVVGIIPDDAEAVGEYAVERQFQEILFEYASVEGGEVGAQIGDRFTVDFDDREIVPRGQEKLRENPCARADFEYRHSPVIFYRVGDASGYVQIFQEMLSQKFFRFYGRAHNRDYF